MSRRRWLLVAAAVAVLSAGAIVLRVVPGVVPGSGAGADPGPPAAGHAVDTTLAHPIVVVGASITAGTGSSPQQAWPALLGRCLGRPVVVRAVPGAGYLALGHDGHGDRGPMGRLLTELPLRRLAPGLVIIQAGHNDVGADPTRLSGAVRAAVDTAQQDAPASPVALLTVFTDAGRAPAAARATDATIVEAAQRADPSVTILDPIAEAWNLPRVTDHLHPTAVGQQLIADRVRADLAAHRVPRLTATADATTHPSCGTGPTATPVSVPGTSPSGVPTTSLDAFGAAPM